MKTVQTNFRANKLVRDEAYRVMKRMGISPTESYNLFLHHIAVFKELPFHPKLQSDDTIKAIQEIESGRSKKAKSTEDFYKKIGL